MSVSSDEQQSCDHSRGTVVSIPFRLPRATAADWTGMSTILPRYSSAWSLAPGPMHGDLRIRAGMTIRKLEQTVTFVMH
jgi:hypothetical protein